jgi:hypothetical protein
MVPVECKRGNINPYRVLVGKLEGKRSLGRPRFIWEDKIQTNVK